MSTFFYPRHIIAEGAPHIHRFPLILAEDMLTLGKQLAVVKLFLDVIKVRNSKVFSEEGTILLKLLPPTIKC